jgi:hypothetical protein
VITSRLRAHNNACLNLERILADRDLRGTRREALHCVHVLRRRFTYRLPHSVWPRSRLQATHWACPCTLMVEIRSPYSASRG